MDLRGSHNLSVLWQIVGSGVIFGLAHAIWGLFGGNLRAFLTSDAYVTSRRERKKVEMLFAHLKHILKVDGLRL